MKIESFLILFAIFFSTLPAFAKSNALAVFDQTADTVAKNFYDQTFRGLPWNTLVSEARKNISPTSTDTKLENTINDLINQLHASHTEFVSSSDQEYWALESVFSFKVDGKPLWQIGAWFTQVGGKWFVKNVFEGGPSEKNGLLPGDEIVSVNGKPFSPVLSFNTGARENFLVEIRRLRNSKTKTLMISSVNQSFQRSMLNASIAGYKVIQICGKKIGYFHLWAGTNDESLDALADAAKKAASDTDAFILDLRDGFGGAYPAFLNPFFDHDDQSKAITQIYNKPLVALINDGVRSGKEWVADILKKSHRAVLVGTQTKGYFLAAKVFPIVPDQFDLYLAVAKGPGPDLEGNGVKPDVVASSELPYSHGLDPQLEKAVQILSEKSCKVAEQNTSTLPDVLTTN